MRALFLVLPLLSVPLAAQTAFSMRNTDTEAVFYYWVLPGVPAGASALARLPLAPGGRHAAAPGERVAVTLPADHSLVGAFVPLRDASLLTLLAGGLILASEVPAKGTLLVDRKGFQALNRTRGWEAPLQEWGFPVPSMVLDGRSADWAGVPNLLEWGPLYRPPSGAWPQGWPRPRSLQAVFRDGALWIRLTLASASFPAGEASLLLRRPGGTLEWPLAGGTVWTWNDTAEPRAVGSGILASNVLEAWIPWDRVGPEASAWTKAEGMWLFAVAGTSVRSLELGASRWDDLP